MLISKLDNVIDLAYWFFDKAADENCNIDNTKTQCLIFLAQIKYAELHKKIPLAPAVFVCDDSGIYEPNLKKILHLGRPLLPKISFPSEINTFLNSVWNEFALLSTEKIETLIKNFNIYREYHQKNKKIILDFKSLVESLNKNSKIDVINCTEKKILNSLNGPVVVSQWLPKRVSELTSKHGG